jgi:hypothetical protein
LEKRNRTFQYKFRVNEDEKLLIEKKIQLANIGKGNYLRNMALNGFIKKQDLATINSLINEINSIGVNINQIAKHANQIGGISLSEIRFVQERVDIIWSLLKSTLLKKNQQLH